MRDGSDQDMNRFSTGLGWERRLVSRGAKAKRTKELINRERIYPPRSGDRRSILDAAAPTVQAPPIRFG